MLGFLGLPQNQTIWLANHLWGDMCLYDQPLFWMKWGFNGPQIKMSLDLGLDFYFISNVLVRASFGVIRILLVLSHVAWLNRSQLDAYFVLHHLPIKKGIMRILSLEFVRFFILAGLYVVQVTRALGREFVLKFLINRGNFFHLFLSFSLNSWKHR